MYVSKGLEMSHVSYSELRKNLAKYMNEVSDSRAPLHITRQNARTVVMVSEDEYEGMVETLHLLRSPANATRLMKSIRQADAGKLRERKVTDSLLKRK
jgi:antitoxin YefM